MAIAGYYRTIHEGMLNYRENRDRAHTEVRNLVRRINNKIDDVISQELTLAELQGREIQIDLSTDGVKRLILNTVIGEFGGVQSVAIDRAHDDEA